MRVTVWWRSSVAIGALVLAACASDGPRTVDTLAPIATAPVPSAADPLAVQTDPTVTTTATSSTTGLPFEGPITVVAVGDSLTVGQGDADRTGYPGRLQERLDQARPGSEVVNLGQSEWTSADVIKGRDSGGSELDAAVDATQQAIDAGRPVVATVLIGTYDLWDLYNHGPADGTGEEQETPDLESYRANITTIISTLQDAGALVLIGLPDDLSLRAVATTPALRRQTFPGISDDEVPRLSAQARRYAAVVGEVATGLDATAVDFAGSMIFTDPAMMSADGNHPNSAGYDAMTDLWWSAIEPLLG